MNLFSKNLNIVDAFLKMKIEKKFITLLKVYIKISRKAARVLEKNYMRARWKAVL
jgi:hypothetical protein